MRIPFIPKVSDAADLGVEQPRWQFITATRGRSAFLLAGAAFWLIGAAISAAAPDARVAWVLYGGLAVPVLGVVIARLQGARLSGHPGYAALVTLATLTELAALPTMFFPDQVSPLLPGW